MGTETKLKITQINRPSDLQMRESLRMDHIDEMAEAIKAGDELPPVRVVQEDNTYWLWDGHHRVSAHETAGKTEVPAQITEKGDRMRARWLAYSANQEHKSLKRSVEDRRKAVRQALQDAPSMSDRAIADHVGVGHPMVANLRKETTGTNSSKPSSQHTTGRDGKTRDTSGISESNRQRSSGKESPPSETGADSEAAAQESEAEAPKPKSGQSMFGTQDRKAAYTKLGQFIRIIAKAPWYEKKARHHCDALMELVKGQNEK